MTNKFIEQRVEALENELSELKLIVAQIRKPSTVVQESLTAASSVEDISPVEKSPNEKRAEIIEKAKMFIENAIERGRYGDSPNVDNGHEYYREHYFDVDFCVKNNKVTALVFLNDCVGERFENKPALIGRSSCAPDDVFNKYIGMAIALGRALGLDVSEFERAVQPTEFAVGQMVAYTSDVAGGFKESVYRIKSIKNEIIWYENGGGYDLNGSDFGIKIINDTNAIYGGGE